MALTEDQARCARAVKRSLARDVLTSLGPALAAAAALAGLAGWGLLLLFHLEQPRPDGGPHPGVVHMAEWVLLGFMMLATALPAALSLLFWRWLGRREALLLVVAASYLVAYALRFAAAA